MHEQHGGVGNNLTSFITLKLKVNELCHAFGAKTHTYTA